MAKALGILGFLMFSAPALGGPCDPPPRPDSRWGMGLALHFLNPTNLPAFPTPVPAYGPSLTYKFLGNPIRLQVLYGADNALSLQLVELGYQLQLRTPYLGAFLEGGGHFLRYSVSGIRRHFAGGYGGTGLLFELASNFAMELGIRAYYQGEPILSFGGGFSVSL